MCNEDSNSKYTQESSQYESSENRSTSGEVAGNSEVTTITTHNVLYHPVKLWRPQSITYDNIAEHFTVGDVEAAVGVSLEFYVLDGMFSAVSTSTAMTTSLSYTPKADPTYLHLQFRWHSSSEPGSDSSQCIPAPLV